MKKLALVMIVALVGCGKQADNKTIEHDYNIKVIDGCEYITYENGVNYVDYHVYSITHKGNCNNPIHKIKDLENKD